ncbi:hypothetical protein [Streptomyces tubercidicus]|uniref:Antitoxin MazE7 n=1 Tax=Streptomyces tubercidicus TaxID=47759 RepID=A0A640UKT3_9ACTN|nr:hypothetical protein [Streptomyces tubercidicus]WAU11397.1 hypothetical protein STRTU_001601 [Streptomyces tubercidicus]GFE36653.1 hypothetical protein Stube_13260 [Streptomyces tubercidicus]
MNAQTPNPNGRELRISVTDDVYDELQILAASEHVPAEEYAARMLADDVARARFLTGAGEFISEHAAGFAERFGPHATGDKAA